MDAGDTTWFPNRGQFSWNGTAPTSASSGDVRHRLSRAGNRQLNRVRTSWPSPTRGACYDHEVAVGKTQIEGMGALKCKLSDVVFRQMMTDVRAARPAGVRSAVPAINAK